MSIVKNSQTVYSGIILLSSLCLTACPDDGYVRHSQSGSGGDGSGGEATKGSGGTGSGGTGKSGSGGDDSSMGGIMGEGGEMNMGGSDSWGGAAATGGDPGSGGNLGTGGSDPGPTGKMIYLTTTPKKANFGGITAADAACNQSPPNGSAYKALIVDGVQRYACTSADCSGGSAEGVDWVLAPNTTYVREDGSTVIGMTSAAGIFSFPLTASFGTSGYSYWTGLSADWTTSADTCNAWSGTSGYYADEGLGDATDTGAIQGVSESCATLAGAVFACVEQ